MSQLSVLARRLREARTKAGLTQEKLGVLAGIDEFSASARMNQYERDKHAPDYQTVCRLGAVLNLPTAYFYAEEDEHAEMLAMFHRLDPLQKREATAFLSRLLQEGRG